MKTPFTRRFGLITLALLMAGASLALTINRDSKVAAASAPLSATLTVTNTNDSGPGSLRQAIIDAASGDTINFDTSGVFSAAQTITLSSGQLAIGQGLNIAGPGSNQLTISGNNSARVFAVSSGANVSLSGLTISKGLATGSFPTNVGGGIFNQGTVTVNGCSVSDNEADGPNALGGAIFNYSGTLNVVNSTISGNRINAAGTTSGGGINNYSGVATVTNSTITGNTINTDNGAIGAGIVSFGTISIASSTITGNAANGAGIGFAAGGGVYAQGQTNVKNTIIALNSVSGPQVYGPDVYSSFSSQGYNLIGNPSGSSGFGAAGDLLGVDPLLDPAGLQDNGGPTKTIKLMPGSPAIDAGSAAAGVTTDQRGFMRPYDFTGVMNASGGDGSDIGAFEVQPTPMTFTVNSLADTDDEYCDALNCTLREAINAANVNPGADTIDFSVTGTITLSSALPAISDSVTVNGPGASQLAVSGNYAVRVFQIGSGAQVSISGLTIRDGNTAEGGGILNDHGTLRLSNCAVSGNHASVGGGVLNDARSGGSAILQVSNCTFSGNSAVGSGGGIDNFAVGGGGVGTATVNNSTFSGNSAGTSGGGINNDSRFGNGTLKISNCTFSGNSGISRSFPDVFEGGGAIRNLVGNVQIGNTIFKKGVSVNIVNESGSMTSLGHSLSDDATGPNDGSTDRLSIDPMLGPLQDNGGPTFTHALLCGSPAIDAGDNTNAPATDQRGLPRIVDGDGNGIATIDIGAFELQTSCNQPPVARAQDITVSADQNCSATITPQQVDNGSSDSDNGDSITLSLDNAGPFAVGQHQVTLTATDNHGASSSATASVNVVDTTPPTLTLNGDNPMIVETCSNFVDPGATANDNCAGTFQVTVKSSVKPGTKNSGAVDTSQAGTQELTYTANDGNGNETSVTRTLIVVDRTPPVIKLTGDSTMTVESCATFADPGATAFDPSCGKGKSQDLTANIVVTGSVDTSRPGSYVLHYNVSDASGNPATEVTRTVNVVDTTPPTITLNGDSVITLEVCQGIADPGVTVRDCDANTKVSVSRPKFLWEDPGTYTVTYTAVDGSGNQTSIDRTFNVRDTTPPQISLRGAADMTVESCSTFVDPGAIAVDVACNSRNRNLSGAIVISGSVDTSTPGTYVLHYNVSDASGNPAPEVTRTVHVVDTTPPTPDASSLPDVNGSCSASLPTAPTATDSCHGKIVGVPDKAGPFGQGDGVITWTFTDAAGNRSTQTQAVHVHDTTAPTIALNGPSMMTVESCASFNDPGATANDSCAGNLTNAIVVTGSVNTSVPGTYVLHYNVSDPSHNAAAEVTRTVKVVDTTPPSIALNGANPMTIELGSVFSDPGAKASDGCHVAPVVTVSGSVNAKAIGTYTLTYSAKDGANNAAAVTRTVKVVDTTAPTITAPAASSAYSDINCQAAVPNFLPLTVATDLGGQVSLSQSPAAGALVGVGSQIITITGKDPSGNVKSVTTTFTVIAGPSFTISINPTSIKRGNIVTLSSSFNNCATTNQSLTLEVSLVNPSGKTLMVSLPFTMKAGQKGSMSIPVPISKSTPVGTYSLTLDVIVAGVKVGTSTAQLTVTL